MEALEVLEKQLQCAICLNTFDNPKALACLHIYCRGCIQQLVLRQQKDQEVECPQCRNAVPVPGNDASFLRTMFFINGLIEVHEIMKKPRARSPVRTVPMQKPALSATLVGSSVAAATMPTRKCKYS